MVFPIGKYKGIDIEDVVYENPDYCIWFLENITGYDYFKHFLYSFLNKELNSDIQKSDFSKIESEIILSLQKNGRSENEAKSIISIYKKQIKNQ